ncbi:hypothetical protein L198_00692 [Cryptococcus wingfieldii CBS 7118]|uniref:Uncharacterized protein n=1 Tax=Cryptococcus wingfieldii CBS 7118 TaxID=1295528 RepID=A0A1E3K7W9_9TREE|nr:hypothetical protein L198_00692 [Cryptococcus wingfieldii CBS 7118]ODO08953.1 hypothetical protein L198_00692 [Cryptococcus wingfieldii CBS 7118]
MAQGIPQTSPSNIQKETPKQDQQTPVNNPKSTRTSPLGAVQLSTEDSGHGFPVHKIRVTSAGKGGNYAQFGLQWLLDVPDVPIVYHTLPPPPSASSSSKGPGSSSSKPTPKANNGLLPVTTTIPKLVTVVERVKREYIESILSGRGKKVDKKGKGKGKGKGGEEGEEKEKEVTGRGLWQYTETGNWTPEPVAGEGEDSDAALRRVLGGASRPKMKHHPYMSITLSTKPLPELEKIVPAQVVYAKSKKVRGKKKSKAKKQADEEMNVDETEEARVKKELGDGDDTEVDEPASQSQSTSKSKGREMKKRKSESEHGASKKKTKA